VTDRRPSPPIAHALAVVAVCALAGPLTAADPPVKYSDRKLPWYDPFGLFVSTPKPTTDKYGHQLLTSGPTDPPAWKWYGYGTPTPGRNALAPNGTYPPVATNWHELARTTPGAIPLARPGSIVPTPLPEVAPIDPKEIVAPTLGKPEPNKGPGPTLPGPPATATVKDDIAPPARLKMPVRPADPAPPTQPVSVPDLPKTRIAPAPPPGVALPNVGSESPDIPVEAAPGIVLPPLTTRGAAPERTPLDEFAAVAKRAETAGARILAVDVVGPKSAVVRLTATTVDVARAVRQHFADAPALRGWRIDFELVTVLKP
jgi:hypothetical protein